MLPHGRVSTDPGDPLRRDRSVAGTVHRHRRKGAPGLELRTSCARLVSQPHFPLTIGTHSDRGASQARVRPHNAPLGTFGPDTEEFPEVKWTTGQPGLATSEGAAPVMPRDLPNRAGQICPGLGARHWASCGGCAPGMSADQIG
jgi:hypothetical protein